MVRCKIGEVKQMELIYYVFDILWLNGKNLKELPLTRRREILEKNLPQEGIIRLSETFETSATEFLAAAQNGDGRDHGEKSR